MIEPPIDKLIKKTECRYALVCGVSKRAKELEIKYPELLAESGKKSISYAADEVYADEIKIIVPPEKTE